MPNGNIAVAAVHPCELPDVPEILRATVKEELEFPREIKRGQKDGGNQKAVRRVQEWCSFHGYQTTLDGDFGHGTEAAVKAFQKANGLATTGVVDADCWAALTKPMHQALSLSSVNQSGTIYDAVLSVAAQHLAVHPVEFVVKGQGNSGPWVRLYMLGKEGNNQPWCAGFVSHVIAQAAFALKLDKPPIPRNVGVDALVTAAKNGKGRFIDGHKLKTKNELRPGCLFVVRNTDTDWTHVGIVWTVDNDHFRTIEGNTNDDGVRDGFEVCARYRSYGKYDFILLG